MNNRESNKKIHFIAIQKDMNVHIAWTKYNPDVYVKADITREQVFEQFSQLKEAEIFTDASVADNKAMEKYYQKKYKENTVQQNIAMYTNPKLSNWCVWEKNQCALFTKCKFLKAYKKQ
jgi:hypothetical protein